jgi:predicted Fe-S protein YdhL (DUF1289 family)
MTVSPCVAICRLDPQSGRCIGCGRTIDEIAAWPALDEAARRAILDRLKREDEARRPR